MSLQISDLNVVLGGAEIIHDLDLEVNSGERFVIMGPSGSGKSTLLRTIAGLVQPNAGSILIDGADITSLPTHKRPIGLMFQDHALFPHLTVADNVAYGLRMAGIDRSSRQSTVAALLDRVGLSGLAERKPDTLSGGEQQRVALARTIALEPSLVMLDEPLGSLDVALREDLLLHIRTVVEQVGTTSLYVTHDRAEAFTFADRLAVIHGGRVVALGTPDAVWNDPGSEFVAKMVGHANVVDGAALGLGPGFVSIPDGSLTIDAAGSTTARVIDSVFDGGRFRIRVDVSGTVLSVSADHREAAGADVRVQIDGRSTIRLTS
jgi:ABC-type Fe3+/spermidine/putrescine transport system ATPase subunit